MKKYTVALFAVVLALAMLAGCAAPAATQPAAPAAEPAAPAAPAAAPAATDEPAKSAGPIAIIVPSADHGWTAGIAYYAQQKVQQLGLAEGTDYKLLTSANVNDMANQIEEALTLGCSAVVLLPHNNEVSVTAQQIMDAGVPLIVFDRKVDNYDAYVGGDNASMGTESAEYLGEKLGGKGTIAVMNTPAVGSVDSERVGGFKAVMAEKYPDIVLIDVTADGYTQEAGLKMATDMLVANPQIDAVFSTDDEPSLGILQAIAEAGRTDIKFVTGGGGAQAFFNKIANATDIELFTATYSPAMIGDAVQVAYDLVHNGVTPAESTIIPSTLVTKANVADYLDASSPY